MATEAGHPASLLTAVEGYVGDWSNERTATGFTRKGLSIKASLFPNRSPQPSKLWVHCPEAVYVDTPRVLCTAGDLILFRVDVSPDCVPDSRFSMRQDCDYFLYRADPNSPVLTLLDDMRTRGFEDNEIGILPRGLYHYTIAVLLPGPLSFKEFVLHLFHSETSSWTSTVLPVAEPQVEFDWFIPTNTDLYYDYTSNIITIGGEHGTMGWVDLWRGILLCDVLREKPTLRGIPLPLPMEHITRGEHLGRAMDHRGIAMGVWFCELCVAVVNGCLKLVHLVDAWAISSWSNSTLENSYEAWGEPECTVEAAEVAIGTDMISQPSGMLLLPSEEGVENPEQEAAYLQRLVISDPSPSLDDDGVVYLIAREKLYHPKSWILALDMNTKTLQSVFPFGTVEEPSESIMYCTSRSASNA
ncbi:hypothetical protein VPH35_121888 [Triticum aestivum]